MPLQKKKFYGRMTRTPFPFDSSSSAAMADDTDPRNDNRSPNPHQNPGSAPASGFAAATSQKHPFWETQPVGQFKEFADPSLPEGPIEPPIPPPEVKQHPCKLPAAYEWATCDIDNDYVLSEVHALLAANYVEDQDSIFRFRYSVDFLRWALRPPGHFPAWHVGVRARTSKKLVAFVSAVPAMVRVRGEALRMAEVNFLCVHKKLRSTRLAPVLIREVTRRVHLESIWQAAYTAGVVLPTPVATCRYWHRPLNPRKLIEVGFFRLGETATMSGTIKHYKLPDRTGTPGFRKMEPLDVPAVARLLKGQLAQFVIAPEFDEAEVEHWVLPREGVVDSYVVQSPESGEVTDFCSFYSLPATVLAGRNGSVLKAAYSYYNVSMRTPLVELMSDALIVAKQNGYDVFNAVDVMQNGSFLRELRFGEGDGRLHYYLYNYRIREGLKPGEIGLVLM